MHTRRRRTPQREIVSSSHHTNTNSETDIHTGEGLGYPPQVFTNLEFAATVSNSGNELDNIESRQNFIGKYCERCSTQTHPILDRCWCKASDWSEDLEVNNNNKNPNLEETQLTPHTSLTKPPSGWSEFRRKTIDELNAIRPMSSANVQASNDRSISPEEFHSM